MTNTNGTIVTATSEIQNMIRYIIHDHSGGIKFTELIHCMVSEIETGQSETVKLWYNINRDDFIDKIFDIVKAMPNIKILEYTWQMSPNHQESRRLKYFVYTP